MSPLHEATVIMIPLVEDHVSQLVGEETPDEL
jgi:hypothetical protein